MMKMRNINASWYHSMPPHASRWERVTATTPVISRAIRSQAGAKIVSTGGETFCFGDFQLVARERVLLRNNVPVNVGSRGFDVLVALVERAGETVNREELFDRVWPDVVVTKVNLRVHVAGLRKALGEGRDGNRFIVSVAGRGYRFVAPVSRFQPAVPARATNRNSTAPLPVRLERMFGRDAAIATLSSQLARNRFISVGGPGGWGHTSVAFAIAHTLVTDFDNAVRFIDLANVDNPSGVPLAVATALEYEAESQEPLDCLIGQLRDREMLLVFSNCDHVFAGIVQLTDRLFSEAPLIHVVISSRRALHPSHSS